MSTRTNPTTTSSTNPAERSYFDQQRELLLREIGISFEHVLSNINKLNRSLEGVIAVGNEFSNVEALWSRFEVVMGSGNNAAGEGKDAEKDGGEGNEEGEGDTEGEVGEEEGRRG